MTAILLVEQHGERQELQPNDGQKGGNHGAGAADRTGKKPLAEEIDPKEASKREHREPRQVEMDQV